MYDLITWLFDWIAIYMGPLYGKTLAEAVTLVVRQTNEVIDWHNGDGDADPNAHLDFFDNQCVLAGKLQSGVKYSKISSKTLKTLIS